MCKLASHFDGCLPRPKTSKLKTQLFEVADGKGSKGTVCIWPFSEMISTKNTCNIFPSIFQRLVYHAGKSLLRTTYLLVCKIGKTVFPAPQPTCTNKADAHIVKIISSACPMQLISNHLSTATEQRATHE